MGVNGSFLGLKKKSKVHKCNYFKKYLFIYKVLHTTKYQVYKGYPKPKTASPRTSERYISLYYMYLYSLNSLTTNTTSSKKLQKKSKKLQRSKFVYVQ